MGIAANTQTYKRSRTGWRFPKTLTILLYITLFVIESKCQNSQTKIDNLEIIDKQCHSCHNSNNIDNSKRKENSKNKSNNEEESFVEELMVTVGTFTKDYLLANKTEEQLGHEIEILLDDALSKDRYEIFDGVEIKSIKTNNFEIKADAVEGRSLFPKYTYEYRLYQKIKTFIDTHVLSINLPKAARLVGFRSFGLKKLFFPLLIGAQIFKSVLLAMFLPSILGSFGKILGKGISQLSASSSQASYPPANTYGTEEQGYATDQKDFMGYESSPTGTYAYPQDEYGNDVNDLSNVDMSRFGDQKVAFIPTKNNYYKNQMATAATNYKVFQKIPASSMILSNYDPFYSPLLSRLDGIFARLGLTPSENGIEESNGMNIGGQSLSDVKLEACREQLICLMYSSPAKYAPYSNLVSAQLSRELNELRRPVSDNPEILRFFRYMRAARRGQEGADCMRLFSGCTSNAAPAHTMIAAYHDINKLVTARKFRN